MYLCVFPGQIARKLHLRTPFKKGRPGREWFQGLKRRHPEFVLRRPEPTSLVRLRAVNPVIINNYFQALDETLSALGLHEKPDFIWNADESGFQLQHQPQMVCARKGAKAIPGRTAMSKESISVMVCGNAAGNKLPPMVVIRGKTSKSLNSWAVAAGPQNALWTYQDKAWMTNDLGEEWFSRVFLQHCGPERPQLLILDGHSSHQTLGLLERAKEENIHILALPPHTTHCLQPLDKCMFGPLKAAYNEACTTYMSADPNRIVNKASWPGLFVEAYEKGVTTANISSGFRACGIYPFCPTAIGNEAFLPSLATESAAPSVSTIDRPDQEPSTSTQISLSGNVSNPSVGQELSDNTSSHGNLEVQEMECSLVQDCTHIIEPYQDDSVIFNLSLSSSIDQSVNEVFRFPTPEPNRQTEKKRETSHRLLTSDKVITQKRIKEEEKKKKEKAKEERTKKREERLKGKVTKKIVRNRKTKQNSSSTMTNANTCSLCLAPYLGDNDESMWVECSLCKEWMHVHCIPLGINLEGISNVDIPFYCHKHAS